MGAGAPANTGEAGATHRGACFAGLPAPTGFSRFLNAVNPFFRTMVTDGAFEKVETQVDENNNPLSVRQENRFVGNFRIWPQYSINFIDLFFEAVGSDVSFTETSN